MGLFSRPQGRGEASPASAQAATRSLLVADDSPSLCDIYRSTLARVRGVDLEATCEPDPRRAMTLAGSRPFDIVVADYGMPGVDGVDILQRALEVNPQGIRVLLTDYDEIDLPASHLARARIDAYLHKPIQELHVWTLVTSILRLDSAVLTQLRGEARALEQRASAPGTRVRVPRVTPSLGDSG